MIRCSRRKISSKSPGDANEPRWLAHAKVETRPGAQAFSRVCIVKTDRARQPGCVPNGTPSHQPYRLNPKTGGKLPTERAGLKEPPVFADDALILLCLQEGSCWALPPSPRGDLPDRRY